MAWANLNAPNLPDFLLFVQNDMQIPAAALPINVAAPSTPALAANTTGGSLATGTVYVKTTYVSIYGETTPSPEASVAVTGPTGQVVVPSPGAQIGAQSYNVYASDATGTEVLQNTSPIALGAAYDINFLATGTAAPPTANAAGSPYPGYAFNQAISRVLYIPGVAAIDYILATYNCAGHLLLTIAPDQSGQSYFATARDSFNLLEPSMGVIASSADQGTDNSFATPEGFKNFTVGDLNFFRTPYGRYYLGYAQDFGAISGLT